MRLCLQGFIEVRLVQPPLSVQVFHNLWQGPETTVPTGLIKFGVVLDLSLRWPLQRWGVSYRPQRWHVTHPSTDPVSGAGDLTLQVSFRSYHKRFRAKDAVYLTLRDVPVPGLDQGERNQSLVEGFSLHPDGERSLLKGSTWGSLLR